MKRIILSWETISPDRCTGTAVVDEWMETQTIVDPPFRSTRIPIQVERGLTSMQNIPPYITEGLRKEITSMMENFFSGVVREECVKWLDL